MNSNTIIKLLCVMVLTLCAGKGLAADIRDNGGAPMPLGVLPFPTDFDAPSV
ncbi:MAG: hypothetical protein LAT61_09410 [Alcanivorax sp.]|nr:hypothetical protein [Alcanivorax sp.]